MAIVVASVTALRQLRVRPSEVDGPGQLIEAHIAVRCLAPQVAVRIAGELAPRRGASAIVVNTTEHKAVLRIRATPVELQGLRSFFEQYEHGPACATTAGLPAGA